MYTIKYEEYHNDYMRKHLSKSFATLDALENWMFDQMQQKYERMWFPTKEPSRIEFTPVLYGPSIWIYMISSERGIEFTDGRFTNGEKHWSQRMKDFFAHCNERKKAPKFAFAE